MACCIIILMLFVGKLYAATIAPEISKCLMENDVALQCNEKNLTEIPSVPRKQFEILYFTGNHITVVANSSFEMYPNSKEIFLQRNEIATIEEGAFSTLLKLQTIDLCDNYLEYISPDIFINNGNLKSVSFQGNPLVNIDSNMPILNAPSLTSLDLSYCTISTLSSNSFSHLNNLYKLVISSNNLQYIPLETLKGLPNLRIVELGSNRWRCGCELGSLLKFISSIRPRDVPPHMPVHCMEPGSRARNTWSEDEQKKRCDVTGKTTDVQITTKIPTTVHAKSSEGNRTKVQATTVGFEKPEYLRPTATVKQQESTDKIDRPYTPNLDSQRKNNSFFYEYQAEILSVAIVIIMIIVTIFLSSLLIRYLTNVYSQPYIITKDSLDSECCDGNQVLIKGSGSDHTYEYIR